MERARRLYSNMRGLFGKGVAAWICLLLISGCVSIPEDDQLIASTGAELSRTVGAGCAERKLTVPVGAKRHAAAIDPAGFTLMTWNLHKAEDTGWRDDLERLGAGQDLLLLQEAHLTTAFRGYLEQSRHQWSMARAFDLAGAATGVLTAAEVPASNACLSRTQEPLIRLPKSVLLTRYPLDGERDDLWVANVHGVNFTLGTTHFRVQLEALAAAVESHRGPLILAGDFNNWSKRRSDILFEVAEGLGLVPLTLTEDARSRHWGAPVDFVFYRGLEVVDARSLEVSSSDHNPILVKFRLPGYPPEVKQ